MRHLTGSANQAVKRRKNLGIADRVLRILGHLVLHGSLVCLLLQTALAGQETVTPQAGSETIEAGAERVVFHSADPEHVGMSAEKLALVKTAIQELVDDNRIPGAIVMVARHSHVVLFESVGWRDIEAEKWLQRDSILRFYSMTKPVTSVAVMMLVEEGKLELDDPVSKYVPELADRKVFVAEDENGLKLEDPNREMTIRDLLRHTAGLTYGFFGSTPIDKKYRAAGILWGNDTLGETMAKLGDLPLLHQPGTRFNYSVATDVLGHIVERISGQSLDRFFQQRIFAPLNMTDTGFHVGADKTDRFANNYGPKRDADGLQVTDKATESRFLQVPKLFSGGGGLVSTARDYMQFCQMLLNKGELNGTRLLKASTVEEMTRNQLPATAYPIAISEIREGIGFGLGFSVVVEKTTDAPSHQRVGEYGWGGAASTHFWISPQDNLAVVALTQHMPYSSQLEETVKPLVYEAIME